MTEQLLPVQHTAPTEAGEQVLVSGVRPVMVRDQLAVVAACPMLPKRKLNAQQSPCDLGLFDEASRDQIDLINFLNPTPKPQKDQRPDTQRAQLSIRKSERKTHRVHEHRRGMVACGWRVQQLRGRQFLICFPALQINVLLSNRQRGILILKVFCRQPFNHEPAFCSFLAARTHNNQVGFPMP